MTAGGLVTDASASASASDAQPSSQRTIHLRLMYRPQLTTLALPRSATWPSPALPPHQAPWHFAPDAATFARFVLATPDMIVKQLEEELVSLEVERAMLASYDTESSAAGVIGAKAAVKPTSESIEVGFVRGAEERVKLQIEKARATETEWLQTTVKRAERDIAAAERAGARSQQLQAAAIARTEDDPRDPGTNQNAPAPTPSIGKPRRRNVNPPSKDSTPPTYHFYQSSTGQPVFLHPLDIRILLARFHTYDAFPAELTLPIEALDAGSIDHDLRKRCKYLGHLPEGGEVVFAQVDVREIVGEDAWREGAWEGLVERRRKEREGRVKREDRDRFRSEEKERERVRVLGAFGPPREGRGGGAAGIGEDVPDPEFFAPVPAVIAEDASTVEPQTQTTGQPQAWGARSFASALHAAPSTRRQAPAVRDEDAWEVDMAWHDLEEQHARNGAGVGAGGGGGKKGRKKLVLMGGGPGRRR